MKATAHSDFHENLEATFINLVRGANYRKLKNRSKFCRDYSANNEHVCGCGFPIQRTTWRTKEGFSVYVEPSNDNNIIIYVTEIPKE